MNEPIPDEGRELPAEAGTGSPAPSAAPPPAAPGGGWLARDASSDESETLAIAGAPASPGGPAANAPRPAAGVAPVVLADRYEVLQELGRGGMGVVYRARDRHLGREIALKLLLLGDHAERADVERFPRETRAAAALQHPGIVQALVRRWDDAVGRYEEARRGCGRLGLSAEAAEWGLMDAYRPNVPPLLVLDGWKGPLAALVFLPDGRRFIAAGPADAPTLCDAAMGRRIGTFAGAAAPVTRLALAPDGQSFLGGAGDGSATLWEVATGRLLRTWRAHAGGVGCVAFGPDGRQFATGGADTLVKVWELDSTGEVRMLRGHSGLINSVSFAPDGHRVLSASHDTTVRLWDVAEGKGVRSLLGHTRYVFAVAFCPDGRHAVSAGEDAILRLWDLESGTVVRTCEGHGPYVNALAALPGGRRVLSAGHDQTVRLWDLGSGAPVRSLLGHTQKVPCVAASADGRRAITSAGEGELILWDFGTPARYRELASRLDCARHRLQDDPKDADSLRELGEWYAFGGVWDWAGSLLTAARRGAAARPCPRRSSRAAPGNWTVSRRRTRSCSPPVPGPGRIRR